MNHSFTILPMNQTFELEPGETYTGSITVANPANSTDTLNYSVTVSPYNVIGEEYQIDAESMTIYSQIVDWISIAEPKGSLEPNETREVEFTITVPENAAGGGQYAALMVSTDPDQQAAQGISINNLFSIGSIIYANVDGDIVHSGEILENQVPYFALTTPVAATAMLENKGNIHETAIVQLTVKNQITGEQIFPTNDEESRGFAEIVMPESTRFVSREIANLPVVGVVQVNQTIRYEGELSVTEHAVIICPIWFMAIIAAVLIGIITGVVLAVRRHHRRKAEI